MTKSTGSTLEVCVALLEMLPSGRSSLAEISLLLGYDVPNSFYRAFRQWTGSTPDAVRRQAKEPSCAGF